MRVLNSTQIALVIALLMTLKFLTLAFYPGPDPYPYPDPDRHPAAAQVALMFLTRGMLPQAPMWDIWLRAAAGRVPLSAVQAGGCGAPETVSLSAQQPASNSSFVSPSHDASFAQLPL